MNESSVISSGYNWEFIWEMIDAGHVFVCDGDGNYQFIDDEQA